MNTPSITTSWQQNRSMPSPQPVADIERRLRMVRFLVCPALMEWPQGSIIVTPSISMFSQ